MNEQRAKRKLSGILSADAVGYSRLMEQDEASTIRTLEESKELMADLIQQYRGRVVDAPGDNLLAEFGSVVDATDCAVKIQEELKTKNAARPDDRKMAFRIGVNLGDIVEEADRIFGDGVNIAARIEGLAEPGGIAVSRTAYDHIKNKLKFGYEYLGEHSVKNITEPVSVYRVLTDPEAAGKVIGEKRFLGRISRRAAIAAVIILVIVAAGLLGWNIYSRQSRKVEAASLDRMVYPLPDKPSIAVLPFDNLSGDPDQEYIADGLTEEIITGLSKIPDLFVIARNSSFTYKGKPVKVQQVSEELGVRYVLEGSVRREGNRIRVTAQLIDAIKGYHVWSERYDREITDLLALQDDIMKNIFIEMRVKLTEGEQARYWTKNEKLNLKYSEKAQLLRYYDQKGTPEGHEMARQLANELMEIDPNKAASYYWIGLCHLNDVIRGISKSPQKSIQLAEEFAQKALQMDEDLGPIRMIFGYIHIIKRQYDSAIADMEKWVALEPNGAYAHHHLGRVLFMSGRREDAIQHLELAIRLDPHPSAAFYEWLGWAYAGSMVYLGPKDPDKAIELCNKALKMNPNAFFAHYVLTSIYSYQNRMEDARFHATEMRRIVPNLSLKGMAHGDLFKDRERRKSELDLFRKAGIPEG